jgi:hypothetical protein
MADYLYMVRVTTDVCLVPRGVAGTSMQQNVGNLGAFGQVSATNPGSGAAPMGQTMRFLQDEMVPNAIATPPTAANIGTAITTAATDTQAQITAAILAQIQAWATGGP